MRKSKLFLWLAIVALFVAAAYLGLRSSLAAKAQQQERELDPAPITVPVTRGDVTQTILAPGQLVSTHESVLSMTTGGQIESVAVRPGSPVRAGDEIAATAGRQQILRSPYDGVIVEVMVRPGETLMPGQGVALLVDREALEVRTTVIEEDFPLVDVGQSADLYFDAQPEVSASGRVVRVVPYRLRGEDRPLYEVYLTIDNSFSDLVPGMTADATIVVAEVKATLRLPRGVLRLDEAGRGKVLVWAAGETQERTVQTGLRGNAYIEVLSGLAEGDLVIGE